MQPAYGIEDIALTFARALVSGDYETSHRLLTPELQNEMSASDLRTHYEEMLSYWTSPPDTIKVGQLLDAPETDSVPGALAWVFVNIDCLNGPGGALLESVVVLVTRSGSGHAIGQVEWGRP